MTRATERYPQTGTLAWRRLAERIERERWHTHCVKTSARILAATFCCDCRGCRWERWKRNRARVWLGWSLVALAVAAWGYFIGAEVLR